MSEPIKIASAPTRVAAIIDINISLPKIWESLASLHDCPGSQKRRSTGEAADQRSIPGRSETHGHRAYHHLGEDGHHNRGAELTCAGEPGSERTVRSVHRTYR